jgi:pyroglutamyl-peptidase
LLSIYPEVFPPIDDQARMTRTILLTGFGPFPGAPFNPTGLLVEALGYRRHPALAGVRRVAHVFDTAYATVDREFPIVLAREKPDVLLMFGLATRARQLRIETRARNALSRVVPDVGGHLPDAAAIAPEAPATLPLTMPAARLIAAARATGVPTVLSQDAGRYLCNYLCWRAAEAIARADGPGVAAFVHVPRVHRIGSAGALAARPPFAFDDLVRAGESIMLAALAAAKAQH